MKRLWLLVLCLSFLGSGLGAAHGAFFIIDDGISSPDAYWGGKPTSDRDVFSAPGKEYEYDFTKMTVEFDETAKKMKVTVFGDFSRPDNNGGDLFLSSTGWRASGTDSHHSGDAFTKDEGWDYVVSSAPKGNFYSGVYKLEWVSDGSFGNFKGTSGSRLLQAFYLDPDSMGLKVVDDVTFIKTDASYYYEFSYAGLGSLGPTSFGVHFTQVCGNDVIEGGTPVPIPPAAFLFASGLAAIALKVRRRLF